MATVVHNVLQTTSLGYLMNYDGDVVTIW